MNNNSECLSDIMEETETDETDPNESDPNESDPNESDPNESDLNEINPNESDETHNTYTTDDSDVSIDTNQIPEVEEIEEEEPEQTQPHISQTTSQTTSQSTSYLNNYISSNFLESENSNIESILLNLLESYETTDNTTPIFSLTNNIPLNYIPPTPRLVRSNNNPNEIIPSTETTTMLDSSSAETDINYTAIPFSMSLPNVGLNNDLSNNMGISNNRYDFAQNFRSLFRPLNPLNLSNSLNRNRFSYGQGNINEIINATLNDPSQSLYKNVINKEAEESIEIKTYTKNEFSDQPMCMMTLNDFKEDDKIALLPCKHIFEKDAVLKWLKTEDARCPICRAKLPSKEIKKCPKISTSPISLTNTRTPTADVSNSPITDVSNSPITDVSSNNIEQQPITQRQCPRRERYSRLFTNMIQNELRRQEEQDLEYAIMQSLRDQN